MELGAPKGNIGDQNYEVSTDLDLNRYRAVTIWCKRFGVNFATAVDLRYYCDERNEPIMPELSKGDGHEPREPVRRNCYRNGSRRRNACVPPGSSGKRILILERGDYVPREKDNWNPKAVNVEAKYNTKELWRDVDGKELHPHTNYYVAGNTKFYIAALFRLRQKDFAKIRHHSGISPAWPIGYAELEPYYTQTENLYQVHGNSGEDPTEPPAGKAYPWPTVTHEDRIQHLATISTQQTPYGHFFIILVRSSAGCGRPSRG